MLIRLLLVILACGCLTLACAPKDDVIAEYLNNARKLGLTPVYPPREEFQVGDMFLVSYVDGNSNDTASIWLDEYPKAIQLIERSMSKRFVFGRNSLTDLQGGKVNRRQDFLIEDLPSAAYPSFTADAGSSGVLGLASALQRIGIGLGTAEKVRLDFTDVRTYFINPIEITREDPYPVVHFTNSLKSLETGQPEGMQVPYMAVIVPEFCRQIERNSLAIRQIERDYRKRKLGGVIVTRVYMTRQIDYTFTSAAIRRLGIAFQQATPTQQTLPDISISVGNTNGESQAQLEQLQKTLADVVAAQNQSGTALGITSWNGVGLRFSRTFTRPVTIAYEAMIFKLTPDNERSMPAIFPQAPIWENNDPCNTSD